MLPTHLNCIPLVSKFDSIFVNRDTVPWLCVRCSETTFPFNHTRDDGEFFSNLSESWGALRGIPYCISNLMEQSRFLLDMNESVHSPLFDIDPDLHALNGQYMTNALTSSSYYLSHTFKSKLQNNNVVRESFSVIHLNIRSANANLKYFKPYLDVLDHDWTCIGLTETWFKDDTFSQFSIPGYHSDPALHTYRRDRDGGGASLFIREECMYKIRKDLTFLEDYIETVFVEISNTCLNMDKNVIVGVVYRPPGANIASFNDKMELILQRIDTSSKQARIMGDFNLNILNADSHAPTSQFVDIMFAHSMYPLINKPTRVTNSTATCIENVFSNHVTPTSKSIQGIFYTDITDHFPIFFIDISTTTKFEKKVERSFTQAANEKFTQAMKNLN